MRYLKICNLTIVLLEGEPVLETRAMRKPVKEVEALGEEHDADSTVEEQASRPRHRLFFCVT